MLHLLRPTPFACISLLASLLVVSCGDRPDNGEHSTQTGAGQGGAGQGGTGQGGAGQGGTGQGGACFQSGCPCVRGELSDCYSGPPATRDVGLCKTGWTTCGDDWQLPAWCMDEVLPATEICLNEVDEDCDANLCAAHLWSSTYGVDQDQWVADVAVSPTSGNIVAVGPFLTSIDFGNGPLSDPVTGYRSGFVAMLNSAGKALSTIRTTSMFGTEFHSVALDTSENIIAVGRFRQDVDLAADGVIPNDTLTYPDPNDVYFVVKYAPDGKSIVFSDVLGYGTHRLSVSATGEIAVVAGSGSLGTELRIYSSTGTVARSIATTTTPARILAPEFDAQGAVFAVGENQIATTLPTNPPVTIPAPPSPFIATWIVKLSPDLTVAEWFKPLGTTCSVGDMAPDGSGGLLVIGQAKIGCDLGGGAVQEDVGYVVRYGPQGEFLWAQLLRSNTLPEMNKVVADSQGNVIVAGTLRAITNADWGVLVPSFDDAFLIKLNPNGGHIWSGALGSFQHNDAGETVATWPSGEVLLGGYLAGYASLGGPTYFDNKGEKDAFLAKFAP